jgi:GTP-binding protein HflX
LDRFKFVGVNQEKAVLVAAIRGPRDQSDDLVELTALAQSAGAVVIDRFQQKIRAVNTVTYIGKGKAELLAERVSRIKADVVIFDNDLSPRQIRELEKLLNVKVLDRSELILDIFATRAQTRQAKLQVELAQIEYTVPRLTRMWSHLDAVAGIAGSTAAGTVGAIGTRGPGEQQLEIDRRIVRKRIAELQQELAVIDKRKLREIDARKALFEVSIVGYTNAGKSTLLNALTDAGVLVEDRLFATLDTRTKKWNLAGGNKVLISDTIGFVRNIPHQLIASFKATLEEAVNADLLIHVVDASNPGAFRQVESVKRVLEEIGCAAHPVITVLNKVDAVKKSADLEIMQAIWPDAVSISAKTGFGLDALTDAVLEKYRGAYLHLRVTVESSDGKTISFLRARADILSQQYTDSLGIIEVKLGQNQLTDLKRLHPKNIETID